MVDALNAASGNSWTLFNGDSAEVLPQLPAESVDFSVYSPPFGDLFTYSDSERDLGNCANDDEFMEQYAFIIREVFRLTKPGRLSAVHCSDLPSRKWKDGFIGTKPFSDDIVAAHRKEGWHLARRITIWRDPVVEMTRTKALNLLHKQVLKDSSCSWPGTPDYLLVFRKPGENAQPIEHRPANFPVDQWQKWASPVWHDISQTDTLNNRASASRWVGDPTSLATVGDAEDEKHLCPLQLHLIERALTMWSNPDEVILSPFAGIGSEGVVSLRRGRRFLGVELKAGYFASAATNLDQAERTTASLFNTLSIVA